MHSHLIGKGLVLFPTTLTNAFGKHLVVLLSNLHVCFFWFAIFKHVTQYVHGVVESVEFPSISFLTWQKSQTMVSI
jgi:hypothetical protein